MARNRKRAKERRTRTPQAASVTAARADEVQLEDSGAPEPLEHAAPDVELAEAQLAVGRPEAADADPEIAGAPDAAESLEADIDADEAMLDEAVDEDATGTGHHPARRDERPHAGARLVGFVQGSWRELQRVQWPDRRQVVQATSVVIGFVIVAGVFLGVADFLAGHLMNYILTGHFK